MIPKHFCNLLLAALLLITVQAGNICSDDSQCIPQKKCSTAVHSIDQNYLRFPDWRDQPMESFKYCGYQSNTRMVCCPKSKAQPLSSFVSNQIKNKDWNLNQKVDSSKYQHYTKGSPYSRQNDVQNINQKVDGSGNQHYTKGSLYSRQNDVQNVNEKVDGSKNLHYTKESPYSRQNDVQNVNQKVDGSKNLHYTKGSPYSRQNDVQNVNQKVDGSKNQYYTKGSPYRRQNDVQNVTQKVDGSKNLHYTKGSPYRRQNDVQNVNQKVDGSGNQHYTKGSPYSRQNDVQNVNQKVDGSKNLHYTKESPYSRQNDVQNVNQKVDGSKNLHYTKGSPYRGQNDVQNVNQKVDGSKNLHYTKKSPYSRQNDVQNVNQKVDGSKNLHYTKGSPYSRQNEVQNVNQKVDGSKNQHYTKRSPYRRQNDVQNVNQKDDGSKNLHYTKGSPYRRQNDVQNVNQKVDGSKNQHYHYTKGSPYRRQSDVQNVNQKVDVLGNICSDDSQCIPQKKCSTAVHSIDQNYLRFPDWRDQPMESFKYCGYQSNTRMVCCPKSKAQPLSSFVSNQIKNNDWNVNQKVDGSKNQHYTKGSPYSRQNDVQNVNQKVDGSKNQHYTKGSLCSRQNDVQNVKQKVDVLGNICSDDSQCIPQKKCSTAVHSIDQNYLRFPDWRDQPMESFKYCGYQSNTRMVCCPKSKAQPLSSFVSNQIKNNDWNVNQKVDGSKNQHYTKGSPYSRQNDVQNVNQKVDGSKNQHYTKGSLCSRQNDVQNVKQKVDVLGNICSDDSQCIPQEKCSTAVHSIDQNDLRFPGWQRDQPMESFKYCGYQSNTQMVCCPKSKAQPLSSFVSNQIKNNDWNVNQKVDGSKNQHYTKGSPYRRQSDVQNVNQKVDVLGNICSDDSQCIPQEKCSTAVHSIDQNYLRFPGWQRDQPMESFKYCGYQSNTQMVCCPISLEIRQGASGVNNSEGDYSPLLPPPGQCGKQNGNRIIGGSDVEIDEHPWMALLRYDTYSSKSSFDCGGTLISSRYVLTAAHCVTGDLPGKLTHVRLGEYNISSKIDCPDQDVCNEPAQDVRVEKVIPHEDYDPKQFYQYHDIALIRLAKNVSYNDFISPICLPLNDLKNFYFANYTNMEVCGWGFTKNYGIPSDVKQKQKVRVVEYEKCKQKLRKISATSQICVSAPNGHGTCDGDSGGPLMGPHGPRNAWIIAGIVSRGAFICGSEDVPTIYARVGNYIDWIKSKMAP